MNVALAGALRVTLEGQTPRIMQAGDGVMIPSEFPHEAVNIGDGPARIVITLWWTGTGPCATPGPRRKIDRTAMNLPRPRACGGRGPG